MFPSDSLLRQLGNGLSQLVSVPAATQYAVTSFTPLPNPECCGIIVVKDVWAPAFAGETAGRTCKRFHLT